MGVKKVKRDGQIWSVRGGIWVGALGLSVGVDFAGEPLTGFFPLDFRVHHIPVGSIFDWRLPTDSVWAYKILPGIVIASCFMVLTWNPWENYVNKANVQGRGIRMKGETAYIVSGASPNSNLFLTTRLAGLANHCVVFADTDLFCIVSGRHGPVKRLPRPFSCRSQLWTHPRAINFTFLFFCFSNT